MHKMTTKTFKCYGCGEMLKSIFSMAAHAQWNRDKGCTDEMRFWGRVEKEGHGGCWIMKAHRLNDGHVELNRRRKGILAHRWSWEMANGPIPDGMWVLHKCDNPPCVNPDHLFLGKPKDNSVDKMLKGRSHNQMPIEKVRQIKQAIAEDTSHGAMARIARRFGVHPPIVSQIKLGRKYGYVK